MTMSNDYGMKDGKEWEIRRKSSSIVATETNKL